MMVNITTLIFFQLFVLTNGHLRKIGAKPTDVVDPALQIGAARIPEIHEPHGKSSSPLKWHWHCGGQNSEMLTATTSSLLGNGRRQIQSDCECDDDYFSFGDVKPVGPTRQSTPVDPLGETATPTNPCHYAEDFATAVNKNPSTLLCNEADLHDHKCVIAIGHTCTTEAHSLEEAVSALVPYLSNASSAGHRVFVAVFLNKVYHDLPKKMEHLSRLTAHSRVAAFSWSPRVGLQNATGNLSFHFMTFAVDSAQIQPVAGSGPMVKTFKNDLYFSGDDNPAKYFFRRELIHAFPKLMKEYGLRIDVPHVYNTGSPPLKPSTYFETLASSMFVMSTPLRDWHLVGTRYFEVMATGSAVLLCYREPQAYDPVGMIEDKHAIMFGSYDEFVTKLLHYTNSTRSAEVDAARRQIALNARDFVSKYHTWAIRAEQVIIVISKMVDGEAPRR